MPFPSKLNDEVIAKISEYVEAGLPFRDACCLAGVSRQAAYKWLRAAKIESGGKHCDFEEALAVSRARFKHGCLQEIRLGLRGWQSKAWLLERLFPQDFGQDRETLREMAAIIKGNRNLGESAPRSNDADDEALIEFENLEGD